MVSFLHKIKLSWLWSSSFSFSPHLLALCRFTGGNWISLVQGGGGWEIRVKGNLAPRADNGRINSSPTTAVPPVLRLRHGATHTITIPGKKQLCVVSSVQSHIIWISMMPFFRGVHSCMHAYLYYFSMVYMCVLQCLMLMGILFDVDGLTQLFVSVLVCAMHFQLHLTRLVM